VEQGCARAVEPDARRLEKSLVEPWLGDRSGDYLEPGPDPINRLFPGSRVPMAL
jgi:hypothetical protein